MFKEQTKRIGTKLKLAKKADRELKVFGARSHRYRIGKPCSDAEIASFESRYNVTLPDCYRAFLTLVGNGGCSYNNSAAGPFYGIYPLGHGVDELFEEPQIYLSKTCRLRLGMTSEEWEQLTHRLENDDEISDDDYEREAGELYAGILPIGSQGCTYLHGIVLNGPHSGKVVNLEMQHYKPRFTYEADFLDWYERWLDEVIAGELQADGAGWFGYLRGGSDGQLLTLFDELEDGEEKATALTSMFRLLKITDESARKLHVLLSHTNDAFACPALRLLTKFRYDQVTDSIRSRIHGTDADCLAACQGLLWYAKKRAIEWHSELLERIPSITSPEAFRFATYLLDNCPAAREVVAKFSDHENKEVRATARHFLSKVSQ